MSNNNTTDAPGGLRDAACSSNLLSPSEFLSVEMNRTLLGKDYGDNITLDYGRMRWFAEATDYLIKQRDDAIAALEAIESRFVDGEDTYEDWKFMGSTARDYFQTNAERTCADE